jgi:hypothetical protein
MLGHPSLLLQTSLLQKIKIKLKDGLCFSKPRKFTSRETPSNVSLLHFAIS